MTTHRAATVDGDEAAPVRVAVVDPRPLIAQALATVLDGGDGFEVVTVVSGAPSAMAIRALGAELVLIGVGADAGLAVTRAIELSGQVAGARIVLVADALSPELVGCVLEHSLGGLLLTERPAADLVASLRHVARGGAILPTGWERELAATPPGPLDRLSDRQLEVLRLLAEGCTYDEIGTRLFISVNTVKFHMRSIFERLGVRNRMAAARVLADDARPGPAGRRTGESVGAELERRVGL